jgi:hypothetical protein
MSQLNQIYEKELLHQEQLRNGLHVADTAESKSIMQILIDESCQRARRIDTERNDFRNIHYKQLQVVEVNSMWQSLAQIQIDHSCWLASLLCKTKSVMKHLPFTPEDELWIDQTIQQQWEEAHNLSSASKQIKLDSLVKLMYRLKRLELLRKLKPDAEIDE